MLNVLSDCSGAIALDVGVAVKIQGPRLGRHSIGFQGILTLDSLIGILKICKNNNDTVFYIIRKVHHNIINIFL